MRALCVGLAGALLVMSHAALAGSRWLESKRIEVVQIRTLCAQVSDVRLLARMQIITTGNARWLRLARQELVIEAVVMGVPPLDPTRCYVIARVGQDNERERRAFEVRDFAVAPERTSVLVIGHAYDLPPP